MASHLSVILDLNAHQWTQLASDELSLANALPSILVFLHSHIAAAAENSLAIYVAADRTELAYDSLADDASEAPGAPDGNTYPAFRRLDTALTGAIQDAMERLANSDVEMNGSAETSSDPHATSFTSALTRALCYINRLQAPSSRILLLSASPDRAQDYVPFMNAIFSAQKLKVPIDTLQLAAHDCVFLQQATYLTGGAYVRLGDESGGGKGGGLLQYLMMCFLPPLALRAVMAVPTMDQVNLRAACFCHKKITDIGFVCSVCLSIFCQPVPTCSTCRTRFPLKTFQRLSASRMPSTTNTPAQSPAPSPAATPTRNGVPTPARSAASAPASRQPSRGVSFPFRGRGRGLPHSNGLPSSNSIGQNGRSTRDLL
ncbi:transcription factor Tfb4-domain-containing protein [Schizophyllum amplum]|uniref:General transcription and DNA repair factor IIH subunit TFB4 n=1 Tax=Schizophyllum amplum TaxID=97359 RepID=A0A550CX82_9AGAR|nr:transcription factor Tfb4-domain-containing protein [Auriculariopsis ampla]